MKKYIGKHILCHINLGILQNITLSHYVNHIMPISLDEQGVALYERP